MNKSILDGVPDVLAELLWSQAYDRGHSGGKREVEAILESLVDDYKPIIELLSKKHDLTSFVLLLQDIYQSGYICGINDDKWFIAYATAIQRIVDGTPFSEDLVLECYQSL